MPEQVVLSPQETALLCGDLSKLNEEQRANLVMKICETTGLNPYLKPFQYIKSKEGALVLYATKSCTEQLRQIHNVSIKLVEKKEVGDAFLVTAQATNGKGRTDESTGAVTIKNLGGDNLCNALMKAETKAKRRVTLSICGLGILDESEIETIAGATVLPPIHLPAPAQALPAATTVAPTVQSVSTAPAEMEAVRLIGKQLGKLAGAVNADLQKLGGDVLTLKQEYERQLANKNPRGAQASAAVAVEVSGNAPAVDGEAGILPAEDYPGDHFGSPSISDEHEAPPSTAPVSRDTVKPGGGANSSKADADFAFAASELMGAFDRSSMKDFCFQDRLEFCSMFLSNVDKKERIITQYSDMSPEECDLVREYINSDMQQPAGGELISEVDLKKLQMELKDASFLAWIQKSPTYLKDIENGISQTEALRLVRLRWATHLLGREVESFKELTHKEGCILVEKFKEMKKK